jgi:ABC-type nitrate/sulfonate/bicarbonate transport system substrate-binding protein
VAFIKSYVRALDWLSHPDNRAEAVAIYRKQIPQASEISATKAWEVLTQSGEGLQKRGRLDRAGMETVLRLRSEFGKPQKQLTDPMRYVDETYYIEAVR